MEILNFIEAVTEYNSYTKKPEIPGLCQKQQKQWQGTIQLPLPKPANLKHPGIELPKATTLTNWNEREHTITTEEHARTTKPTEESFEN